MYPSIALIALHYTAYHSHHLHKHLLVGLFAHRVSEGSTEGTYPPFPEKYHSLSYSIRCGNFSR